MARCGGPTPYLRSSTFGLVVMMLAVVMMSPASFADDEPAVEPPPLQAHIATSWRWAEDGPQILRGWSTGGHPPVHLSWDLGSDGSIDLVGAEVTVAPRLPRGVYPVSLVATDANNTTTYRNSTITVVDGAEHSRYTACLGPYDYEIKAMEFHSSGGTCWMHGGHHTFWMGGAWLLRNGTAHIFSVEQQFAPSAEYQDNLVDTPIRIQASWDAHEWWDLTIADYRFVGFGIRQSTFFELEPDDRGFQFIRVHNPRSITEGLSGFLDGTRLRMDMNATQAPEGVFASPDAGTTESYDCRDGDHIEDYFDDHPCWFGGIDRYDAASFWHTYPIGETPIQIEQVSGEVTVLPWRTDDWYVPLFDPATQFNETTIFLWGSADGSTWTQLGNATVLFGVNSTFAFDVGAEDGFRFLQLHADEHPEFDRWADLAPLHHLEGYLLDSRLTVSFGNHTG